MGIFRIIFLVQCFAIGCMGQLSGTLEPETTTNGITGFNKTFGNETKNRNMTFGNGFGDFNFTFPGGFWDDMPDFDGGGGGMFDFPVFDMEIHMQDAIGTLGVITCLTEEASSDLIEKTIIMGGIMGLIFGQVQGQGMADQGDYMNAGGLAGIAGAASGMMPFGEDMMPGMDEMDEMWSKGDPPAKDDKPPPSVSSKAMEHILARSRSVLRPTIKDGDKIAEEIEKSGDKPVGTSEKITKTSSVAGETAGIIADFARRALRQSPDPKQFKGSIEKAIPKVKEAFAMLAGSERSTGASHELITESLTIGKKMGVKGVEREEKMAAQIQATDAMTPLHGVTKPELSISSRMVTKQVLEEQKLEKEPEKNAREVMETCVEGVMSIMDEIDKIQNMMTPPPKFLDWTGPFHVDGNVSYSKLGLPKYVAGDRFVGDWDFSPLPEVTLPDGLKVEDFDESFVPDILKDPVIVDLIHYASRMKDTSLIDFLKGSVSARDLHVGALRMLPRKVLMLIPDKDSVPIDNLIDLVKYDQLDVVHTFEFIANLSTERWIELLVAASDLFYDGEFMPSPPVTYYMQYLLTMLMQAEEYAAMVDQLTSEEKIALTCPYGLVPAVVETIEDDVSDNFGFLNHCLKHLKGRSINRQLFEGISNSVSFDVDSADALLQLEYLINFGQISMSLNGSETEKLATSNIGDYIKPSMPAFVDVTKMLSHMMIGDVNDTAAINSSGLISCGVLMNTADSFMMKGPISEEAKLSAINTCRTSLGPFMKQQRQKQDQCKGGGCDADMNEDMDDNSDMDHLMKLLEGGKRRHSPDGPDSLMGHEPKDIKKILTDNPDEAEMLRPIDKIVTVFKMRDNLTDFLSHESNYKSLTAKIPVSLLEDMDIADESLHKTLTSARWNQQQALQMLGDTAHLTLHDIRDMGSLAVGLTCHDVMQMNIDVIMQLAKDLEYHISDAISPNLAECMAMKMFLHIHSRYPGMRHLSKELSSKIPPVFAAFLPVNLIAEYGHCEEFYKKIIPLVHRLFPTAVSRIYLEDLVTYAIDCFSNGDDGEEDMNSYDSEPDRYDMNDIRKKRDTHGKDQFHGDEKYNGPDKYNGDDEFYGGMMNGMPKSGFDKVGDLICFVKPDFIGYEDEKTCKTMMKAMRRCIHKISNQTLSRIQRMIVEMYGTPTSWNETVLREIGPFVPTMPYEILEAIPADDFVVVFDAIKPPPRRSTVLMGDLTSAVDVTKIMNIPSMNDSGPSLIETPVSPFNYADFYTLAVKRILPKTPTVEDLRRLGPDSLPYLPIADLNPEDVHEVMDMLGAGDVELTDEMEQDLKDAFLQLLKNKGDVFSDDHLFNMAKRASVFDDLEIADVFSFSKVGTLARLGEAKWKDAKQVRALMNIFMDKRSYGDLNGPEIVAMGNMHCHLNSTEVSSINAESVKFALHSLGKLRCFDQDHIDMYKEAVQNAFGTIDASTLLDMGVLAAGFSASELDEFGKSKSEVTRITKDVYMIPASAMKVIPATRILSSLDDNQLLRLGTVNGGMMLQRQDIFEQLSNNSKNAVFAAAFGLNAGVYASYIEFARNLDFEAQTRMEERVQRLMEQLTDAFMAADRNPYEDIFTSGFISTSAVFGLPDISMAKRPEADSLVFSKTEVSVSFDQSFFNDRVVVNMINSYSEENSVMIDVFTGKSTLNDISDDEWSSVPVKMLQGFGRDTIQDLSSDKLAVLLDSDDVSKDPASLSRILDKLDLTQFKDALKILKSKTNETADGVTWRPPISIQSVIADAFFRFRHGGEEEELDAFLEYMCPFSAGVDSWHIMMLPSVESYIVDMLECFDLSYKDLESFQKRSIVNWVLSMWDTNDMDAVRAQQMRNFLMDLPLYDLTSVFNYAEVMKFVNAGGLLLLDSSHEMFHTVSGFITRTIQDTDPSKFSDDEIMRKLGRGKCEIKARKVKSVLDSASMKKFLDYTMQYCKDRESELQDSMSECTSEAALRLQRCRILEQQIARMESKSSFSSYSSSTFTSVSVTQVTAFERPSVQEFETMKIVMESFQAESSNKDFTQYTSSDIRTVAGAFSILKPKEIDDIPDEAILDNMDALKNNTNLSTNQKRKIFSKIVSAGFEVTTSSSIMELGEFVTSVPSDQFKQLDAEGIKESLGELSKHAKDFSPAQKKAIMETLNDGNVTDMIQQDLGDLVTEIPVSDLKDIVIGKEDLEKIGKQPWTRGQAANLFRQYRKTSGLEDTPLSVDDIREMGRTSIGLSCKDIMKILDDESYDAAQALVEQTERSLTLDMNDCIATKLHYSLRVLYGADYISNDTDTNLETILQYIPEDIAMMMPTDELAKVPSTACMELMANIGKARLNLLPLAGSGLERRKALANITMACIVSNRLQDHDIDVGEALTFGQLVCDLEVEHWTKFSLDAFIEMLAELSDCFYRLPEDKIQHLMSRIYEKYGSDSTTWTEDVLSVLGPLMALMSDDVISKIPEDTVYESMDDVSPPQLEPELPAHQFMNYEAVYGKFVDSVMSQRVSDSRRRREVTAPDYDEIVLLGAGNVAWSAEELDAITDDDFSNALSVLGAIGTWSSDQSSTLVAKLKSIYGSVESWAGKVISDAQHLIGELSASELTKLVIDDIEAATQLSSVNFTNAEKHMIIEGYLRGAKTNLSVLSSSELAGFGSLACGINTNTFTLLMNATIRSAIKDLGKQGCFSQDQYDFLKTIAVSAGESQIPSAAELDDMGTIAAGLTIQDLSALPVESMAFIKPAAFLQMTPSRIRDGLNESQLVASGAGNIAALMTESIFDELTMAQRNALRKATYGDDAELEDESSTALTPTGTAQPDGEIDPDDDDVIDGSGDVTDNDGSDDDDGSDETDPGDNTVDDASPTKGADAEVTTKAADGGTTTTTTTVATEPDGSPTVLPSVFTILSLLIVAAVHGM